MPADDDDRGARVAELYLEVRRIRDRVDALPRVSSGMRRAVRLAIRGLEEARLELGMVLDELGTPRP